MIDLKILRSEIDVLKKALINRNSNLKIEEIQSLELHCRQINNEIENLNAEKNKISKIITDLIKNNKKDEIDIFKEKIANISNKINILKEKINVHELELNNSLLLIPNMPDSSVPIGKNEEDNVEVRKVGQIRNFEFIVQEHWQLGKNLDIIDLETSSSIAGSRFSIYKNKGSKLLRALQNLTLDILEKNGFIEFTLPVIVNENALKNTGQFPVLKDDIFKLNFKNFYLSPTIEVQLTNLYANKMLNIDDLPKKVTGSSLNFRLEAGSAGKDIKGLIRQHQFQKTEMVIISDQEKSFEMLESMVDCAEQILKELELPYRVITLCTGDMGFASAKTYDIEVYMPSIKNYREISSCSNCTDFQSRRSSIKYKDQNGNKKFAHTLNGSGLALDRLWVAIVENYQQKDGSVVIPKALKKYLNFDVINNDN